MKIRWNMLKWCHQYILKFKKTAKKTTFKPDPEALDQRFFDHDDEVANWSVFWKDWLVFTQSQSTFCKNMALDSDCKEISVLILHIL